MRPDPDDPAADFVAEWFFVPSDREPLGVPTVFTSSVWDPDPFSERLGEVRSTRRWARGTMPLVEPASEPPGRCGEPRLWLDGWPRGTRGCEVDPITGDCAECGGQVLLGIVGAAWGADQKPAQGAVASVWGAESAWYSRLIGSVASVWNASVPPPRPALESVDYVYAADAVYYVLAPYSVATVAGLTGFSGLALAGSMASAWSSSSIVLGPVDAGCATAAAVSGPSGVGGSYTVASAGGLASVDFKSSVYRGLASEVLGVEPFALVPRYTRAAEVQALGLGLVVVEPAGAADVLGVEPWALVPRYTRAAAVHGLAAIGGWSVATKGAVASASNAGAGYYTEVPESVATVAAPGMGGLLFRRFPVATAEGPQAFWHVPTPVGPWPVAAVWAVIGNYQVVPPSFALLDRQGFQQWNNPPTTSFTPVYSVDVPAGTLGPNGVLRVRLDGIIQSQVSGGASWRLNIYFGSTLVYNDATIALGGASTGHQPYRIDLTISNQGAANSQLIGAVVFLNTSTKPTTGDGTISAIDNLANPITGNAAEDTTATKTLSIQWRPSVTGAAVFVTRGQAVTEALA